MNPNAYRRSLSKFRPQQVVADASSAPRVPGMAAGNMAPPTEDAGAGVFVPPGTPGAPPQSPMGGGSPFAGDPAGALGGPMQAPSPINNIRIGGTYNNEYGAEIKGNYNPTTGRVEAAGQIPIGDYRKGYYVGGSAYYNPNSQLGGADYGGAITFGKRNKVPEAGTLPNKYEFGLTIDSRRQLPGMGSNVRPANGIGQVPNNRMGPNLNQPSPGMALTPQDKFLMQGQAGQMQQMMGLPVQQTVPGFNPGAVR